VARGAVWSSTFSARRQAASSSTASAAHSEHSGFGGIRGLAQPGVWQVGLRPVRTSSLLSARNSARMRRSSSRWAAQKRSPSAACSLHFSPLMHRTSRSSTKHADVFSRSAVTDQFRPREGPGRFTSLQLDTCLSASGADASQRGVRSPSLDSLGAVHGSRFQQSLPFPGRRPRCPGDTWPPARASAQ